MAESEKVRVFGLLAIGVDGRAEGGGGGRMLLMQRKDPGHPAPGYRGKLTFFGGSIPEVDAASTALELRLARQFGEGSTAALYLAEQARTTSVVDMQLQDGQGPVSITVFSHVMPWTEFSNLRSSLMLPGEGNSVLMSDAELRVLIRECPEQFLPDMARITGLVLDETFR